MRLAPTHPVSTCTHPENNRSRSVCVVGLGYVGLPIAAVLAERGHRVCGVDIRPDVVQTINRGEIHIHEPDLAGLVRRVVRQGNLVAALTPRCADVFMICVPTPVTAEHAPDVSYVEKAAESIRPYVREGSLIVLESTSPPGTTRDVIVPRCVPPGMAVGSDVFVAYCPERILPGRTLVELVENDRVVGGMTPECAEHAARFYQSFVKAQISRTSALVAELVKLAENASRDVGIAFANELSILAGTLGADVFEIIELANRHPRVKILRPGPGVGGHCISVDPWFLVHAAPELTPLMRSARAVNDRKPHVVVEEVVRAAAGVASPVIGCLGLAYKSDVDDLRESPALEVVRELSRLAFASEVLVCEPFLSGERFDEFPLVSFAEVLRRANIIVLLTNHTQFQPPPPEQLAGKIVIDPHGAWKEKHTSSFEENLLPFPSAARQDRHVA